MYVFLLEDCLSIWCMSVWLMFVEWVSISLIDVNLSGECVNACLTEDVHFSCGLLTVCMVDSVCPLDVYSFLGVFLSSRYLSVWWVFVCPVNVFLSSGYLSICLMNVCLPDRCLYVWWTSVWLVDVCQSASLVNVWLMNICLSIWNVIGLCFSQLDVYTVR
jgi:hypothetical protein